MYITLVKKHGHRVILGSCQHCWPRAGYAPQVVDFGVTSVAPSLAASASSSTVPQLEAPQLTKSRLAVSSGAAVAAGGGGMPMLPAAAVSSVAPQPDLRVVDEFDDVLSFDDDDDDIKEMLGMLDGGRAAATAMTAGSATALKPPQPQPTSQQAGSATATVGFPWPGAKGPGAPQRQVEAVAVAAADSGCDDDDDDDLGDISDLLKEVEGGTGWKL